MIAPLVNDAHLREVVGGNGGLDEGVSGHSSLSVSHKHVPSFPVVNFEITGVLAGSLGISLRLLHGGCLCPSLLV